MWSLILMICSWMLNLRTSSCLKQELKLNLYLFLSVLFIFSELILCRINPESFTVAKLSLCRAVVKFLASIFSGITCIIQSCSRCCLNKWIVLNKWLHDLVWNLQDRLLCLPSVWCNFFAEFTTECVLS